MSEEHVELDIGATLLIRLESGGVRHDLRRIFTTKELEKATLPLELLKLHSSYMFQEMFETLKKQGWNPWAKSKSL